MRPISWMALLGAAAAGLGASPAMAQSIESTQNEDVIVVTAARRAQPIEDVLASVEVIGQDRLETFAGSSVTEALRYAAGVDARSSGANSTVTIRGVIPGAGAGVQILYDGLPRPAKYGIGNLNLFGLEDVQQVEIIRGPMSALYGANAIGGVVNVITVDPGDGPGLSLRATAGAMPSGGDRATGIVGASWQGRLGDVGHRISLETRQAEGFRFNGAVVAEDLTGIDQTALAYTGLWSPTDAHQVRWSLEGFSQDDRRASLLAAAPPGRPTATRYEAFEREDRIFGALQYQGEVGPGVLSADLSLSQSEGETNRSFPTIETTDYSQSLAQARYFVEAGQHGLTFGAGAQRDEIDVSINSVTAEQDNLFAYVQDEWRFAPGWQVVAGVRVDDFDAFGAQTSPRVTLGWTGDGPYARVGYGQAFRAPTVLEQFSSFTRGRFIILGTPTLQPESSKSYEAAFGWRGDGFSFEAVIHDTLIDDLIETFQPGGTIGGLITTRYRNRAEADLRGVELSGRWAPTAWFGLSGSYDYLEAEDAQTGVRLNGRATHTFRAVADFEVGDWSGTLRARHLEDLWGPDPAIRGSAPFGSEFTVVDVQGSYRVREDLQISVGIDNLFDATTPVKYSTVGAIEDPPGTFAYVTLRWTR